MKITDPLFSGNTVISGSFKVSGSFNVNDNDLSAGAVGFPFSGSAAVTGSLNVTGSIFLNGQALVVSLVPIYGSTSPIVLNSTASIQTLTVSGENFDGSAIGYVKGNDGTRYNPTTSVRNSDIQLTLNFSGSDRLTSANEPYDIYILNGNGENTFEENVVYVDASPVWQTAAGNLGTIFAKTSATSSFTIQANDPDSNDTVNYFITGGALPAEFSLISASNIAYITGSGNTIPTEIENYNASGVVHNVTVAATDSVSTVLRTFSITKQWNNDGSVEQLAVTNTQALRDLGITTNGNYWINDSANGQTAAKQCYVNFGMLDSKDWIQVFQNSNGGTATLNHVGSSIPWKGFCVEDPNGSFYYTYYSSFQPFDQRNSTNLSTGGNRSGYKVFIGLAGGHGIYNSAVLGPCNWSNNSSAAGAIYDGTCGTYPDGLVMGLGGNPVGSTVNGTWKYWLWMG